MLPYDLLEVIDIRIKEKVYAPPLANVLLDFARRLWEDILKAAVEVGSLVSGKAPDGGQNAGGSGPVPGAEENGDEQIPYSYPIPQGFADKTVMVPELRANYLTEEKYEKIRNHFFGKGNGIGAYYEPTRYFFDLTRGNPAVLAEYGNNDAMRTGYAYGADSRLLSMAQDDLIGFYIHDGRGSVSELIQSAQIESYRYEPYGVMIQGVPKQDRVFGFNGEEYTPQTGLQYLRARHYNPFDGRFTTQDTYLGNLTQTITQNRYAYCNNDPVTNIDPSGFASKKNVAGSSSAPKSGTGSSGSSNNVPNSITPQAGYNPNATTTLMKNGVPVGTYNLSTGQLVSPIVLGSGYHPNQTATMYKDGVPAYTVYLASGIRVPILPANYYNYSQNPKVSASSGGLAALQQYFNKLAVQQNMLYFSGTTTNAERALWDSLWKDTVPNMSFSQVVDVWQAMTLLNVGAGYSAKDAMTMVAIANQMNSSNQYITIPKIDSDVPLNGLALSDRAIDREYVLLWPVLYENDALYWLNSKRQLEIYSASGNIVISSKDYTIVRSEIFVKASVFGNIFGNVSHQPGDKYFSALQAATAFGLKYNTASINSNAYNQNGILQPGVE